MKYILLLVTFCFVACVLEGREHTAQEYFNTGPHIIDHSLKRNAVIYANNFDNDNGNNQKRDKNCSVRIDNTKHNEKQDYSSPVEDFEGNPIEENDLNRSIKHINCRHDKKHENGGSVENSLLKSNEATEYIVVRRFENKHYNKHDDYEAPDATNKQIKHIINLEEEHEQTVPRNDEGHFRNGPMTDPKQINDYYYNYFKSTNVTESPDVKYNQINKIIPNNNVYETENDEEVIRNGPANGAEQITDHYYESSNVTESPDAKYIQTNKIIRYNNVYKPENDKEVNRNGPANGPEQIKHYYYESSNVIESPDAKYNHINKIIPNNNVYVFNSAMKSSEEKHDNYYESSNGRKDNYYFKNNYIKITPKTNNNQIKHTAKYKKLNKPKEVGHYEKYILKDSISSLDGKNHYYESDNVKELPDTKYNLTKNITNLKTIHKQTKPTKYQKHFKKGLNKSYTKIYNQHYERGNLKKSPDAYYKQINKTNFKNVYMNTHNYKKTMIDNSKKSSGKERPGYYGSNYVTKLADANDNQINIIFKKVKPDYDKKPLSNNPLKRSGRNYPQYYGSDYVTKLSDANDNHKTESPDAEYKQIDKIIEAYTGRKSDYDKEFITNSPIKSSREKNYHYYKSSDVAESPDAKVRQLNKIKDLMNVKKPTDIDNYKQLNLKDLLKNFGKNLRLKVLRDIIYNWIAKCLNLETVQKQTKPGRDKQNIRIGPMSSRKPPKPQSEIEEYPSGNSNQIQDIINLKNIFNKIESNYDKEHVSNGRIKSSRKKPNNYYDTAYFEESPNAEDDQNSDMENSEEENLQMEPDNYKQNSYNDRENNFFYNNNDFSYPLYEKSNNGQTNTKPYFGNDVFDKWNIAKDPITDFITGHKSDLNEEPGLELYSKTQEMQETPKSEAYQVLKGCNSQSKYKTNQKRRKYYVHA